MGTDGSPTVEAAARAALQRELYWAEEATLIVYAGFLVKDVP